MTTERGCHNWCYHTEYLRLCWGVLLQLTDALLHFVLLCYTDRSVKTSQSPNPFQALLPSLIILTLMGFTSSCFTLAVKVNYDNKTLFIVWQNDFSFVAKSKGFNKKKLNDRRLGSLGNCYRSVVCWITPWERVQADEHFPTNDNPSLRTEVLTLAASCPDFWQDVWEDVVFTATQTLPQTSNWTWQKKKIMSFSSYFQNTWFLTQRSYLFTL